MKLSFIKKTFLLSNFIFYISILILTNKTFSQSVGIGTNTPNSSAQLEIKSNTKGILIPRTSYLTRIGILNPAKALLIYDTVYNSFWFYNGTDWIESSRIDQPTASTFLGFQTGTNNIGVANTGIGHQALSVNITGGLNTALGYFSLMQNNTGHSNTAVGNNSLRSNIGGSENTAIGSNSLSDNTIGMRNTAIGNSSLNNNTTGSNNSAIGEEAMNNNTTGYNNIAAGFRALYNNGSGYSNVAIGTGSLSANSVGYYNIAIGDSALSSQNTNENIAIGSKALRDNLTGQYNIALGDWSLINNKANKNIAMGHYALLENTTGSSNIALGTQSLYQNTTGSNNISIGDLAGRFIEGSNNIVIGASAEVNPGTLSGAIAIGYNTSVSCSNCMTLGNQIRVGINNALPVADLHILQLADANGDNSRGIRLQRPTGTGTHQWRVFLDPLNNYIFQYNNNLYSYIEPVSANYVNSSDERLKTDINPLSRILDKLMLLQPKTYQYTASSDANRHSYGFLAQEVEKLFPDFVYSSENGMKGIAYSNFSVIAVKAIQEQQQLIEILMKKNEELEKRLTLLEKK